MTDPRAVLRDVTLCHPLVQARWPLLEARLLADGFPMRIIETYRPEDRQQYLFGAGRSVDECLRHGVPSKYARPTEKKVTNAWSAKTSAHGWMMLGKPAAAALDVVPVGADGKPYTPDDPWDAYLAAMTRHGYTFGLVHFHKPGQPPPDRPHLQLREWSDALFRVITLPGA